MKKKKKKEELNSKNSRTQNQIILRHQNVKLIHVMEMVHAQLLVINWSVLVMKKLRDNSVNLKQNYSMLLKN